MTWTSEEELRVESIESDVATNANTISQVNSYAQGIDNANYLEDVQRSFIKSGCEVSKNAGTMTVTLDAGSDSESKAYTLGRGSIFEDTTLTVTANTSGSSRIDIIYLSREGGVGIKTGTPDPSPSAPDAPTNTQIIYELLVPTGTTTDVTGTTLTDKRTDYNFVTALPSTGLVVGEKVLYSSSGDLTEANLYYWSPSGWVVIGGNLSNITTNAIPKGDGTALTDSRLSDDGTTLTLTANTGLLFNITDSSANPLYQFSSNISNAAYFDMFYGVSGKVRINTNGDSYFNGGNVGIGTTSPLTDLTIAGTTGVQIQESSANNVRYQIVETGTGNGYGVGFQQIANAQGALQSYDSSWIDILTWNSAGNVGIGTTLPQSKLHIEGTELRLDRTGSTFGPLIRLSREGLTSWLLQGGATASTDDFRLANASGTNVLTALQNGNVGIGTTNPQLKFVVSNGGAGGFEINPAGASSGVDMVFYNRNTSAYIQANYNASQHVFGYGSNPAANTGMLIDSSGNVGIGTPSTVSGKLHLYQNFNSIAMNIEGTGAGATGIAFGGGNYGFIDYNATASGLRISTIDYSASSSAIKFGKNSNAAYGSSTFTEQMRISYSGNVGIGTSSPSAKLDVLGSVRIGSDSNEILQVNWDTNRHIISTSQRTTTTAVSDIEFRSYGTGAVSNILFLKGTGNVGIGTASPLSKLVVSNGSNENFEFHTGNSVSAFSGGTIEYINRTSVTTRPDLNLYVGTASGNIKLFTAGVERFRVDGAGNVGIGTDSPSCLLDINSDILRLRTNKTPSSASDTGNAGDICFDSDYVYRCVATNTWKRAALSTW